MLKHQLNWKRPLFFLLLPTFFVMAFLGFPLPVLPPPPIKPAQEQAAVVKNKKKHFWLIRPNHGGHDSTDRQANG